MVLHNKLLTHILRLPKSFFDTNPAGRVLNRFSRDIETMDSVLNQNISQTCNCFATYLATLIVISVGTQWFGLAVVPITFVYIVLQVSCCCCARLFLCGSVWRVLVPCGGGFHAVCCIMQHVNSSPAISHHTPHPVILQHTHTHTCRGGTSRPLVSFSGWSL